jgi:hypothetical protein
VGILSNGKINATPLLNEIVSLLVAKHGMRQSVVHSMTESAEGPGFPAPGWMIDSLASSSSLTLVGVGD